MLENLNNIWETDLKIWAVYIAVYLLWGIAMNYIGMKTKIARFRYAWQIITCYVVYMIPVSLFLKDFAWYEQYAYGLFFMGLLELGGYTIKSSIAYENNILDKIFGERNFTLAMTLFFASYFPIGNGVVGWICSQIF